MGMSSRAIFRIVLFLAGSFVVLTGLDNGLGGMRTLGWMGPNDFVVVQDAYVFAVQDNHAKFLGGIWFGVGLTLWAGAWSLERFDQALKLVFSLIFLGGVMRVVSSNPEIFFGPDIVGALAAELIGMPILYLWHRQVLRSSAAAAA
jgi:Domain of unknown function (DUF4345)